MAEARNAIDLYYLQKQGFQITGVEDGYFTLTVSVPYPTTLVQTIYHGIHDVMRFVKRRLWPASMTTVLAVMAGVSFATIRAPKTSWFRSGNLANVLWTMDSVLNKYNPLHKHFTPDVRVGYLAAGAAFFSLLAIATCERLLLRVLLRYKGWLYVKPKTKPPVQVVIWGFFLKVLIGSTDLMYSFSLSLPTLPLPSLNHTIKCYLESVKPLLSEEEYKKTEQSANDFKNGEGRKFQLYLYYKWFTTRNYVASWWEKYVYLRGRTPLAVNSNYYVMDSKFRPTTSQVDRAAHVVHHFLKFKDRIEDQKLKPMLIRGMIPLCMDQYKRMFGTCRVPGREFDVLKHVENSRHIVVLYRGEYYRVNMYHGVRGTVLKPYSADEIKLQLHEIIKYTDKLRKDSPSNTNYVAKGRSTNSQAHRIQSYSDLSALRDSQSETEGKENVPAPVVAYEGSGISSLTAGPRSNWAEVREVYFSSGINKASLDAIEKASFLLVLETEAGTTMTGRARTLFVGNGYNRHFDKSLSVIVFKDGYIGLNSEHSWADAPVVAHLWEYALLEELGDYQQKIKPKQKGLGTSGRESVLDLNELEVMENQGRKRSDSELNSTNKPLRLLFDVDEDLERTIQQAGLFAKSLMDDVDLQVLEFSDFGAAFMKSKGLSPDAFVQMALQLAYYRQHKQFDLTYESSMTRLFRFGRTETIRSLTTFSMKWVKAMEANKNLYFATSASTGNLQPINESEVDSGTMTKKEVIALLHAASNHHSILTKDSMVGLGIDRHLFSLYITSRGFNVESKFLNEALSIPWRLSTSQQPQDQTPLRKKLHPDIARHFVSPGGGFGPVADDGYGVSYMIPKGNTSFFHVSSKFSAEKTSSKEFVNSIKQALYDMKALLS